jgi:hypothetical protein
VSGLQVQQHFACKASFIILQSNFSILANFHFVYNTLVYFFHMKGITFSLHLFFNNFSHHYRLEISQPVMQNNTFIIWIVNFWFTITYVSIALIHVNFYFFSLHFYYSNYVSLYRDIQYLLHLLFQYSQSRFCSLCNKRLALPELSIIL